MEKHSEFVVSISVKDATGNSCTASFGNTTGDHAGALYRALSAVACCNIPLTLARVLVKMSDDGLFDPEYYGDASDLHQETRQCEERMAKAARKVCGAYVDMDKKVEEWIHGRKE